MRTIRLPAAAGSSLERAARAEAAGHFPFDLRGARVQVIPAGRPRQGAAKLIEVIVLAAPGRALDDFIMDLDAAGVVVESLDPEPCAVFRAAQPFLSTRVPGVVVDVGGQSTDVLIGRERAISFVKSFPVGWEHLDEAVSRAPDLPRNQAGSMRRRMGISGGPGETPQQPGEVADRGAVNQAIADVTRRPIEAIARGISACLRYHAVAFPGSGPDKIYVSGDSADDEPLLASLSALLHLPVAASEPLASMDVSRMPMENTRSGGAWAVAAGLALKRLALADRTTSNAARSVEAALA